MAALAVPAAASIAPTVTLDQSAGDAAGSTANLGRDLKFAPTGTDSPDDMTLNLPRGLLANASVDGGACLKTADLSDTACPHRGHGHRGCLRLDPDHDAGHVRPRTAGQPR